MSLEGADACRLLVSPLPVPIPEPLPVRTLAEQRSVLLVDSRKPNARRMLTRIGELLTAARVEVGAIADKLQPTAAEDDARLAAWGRHRGLILLGVFD
jgi:hypothetical protein